jgi:hypothetical protein
MFAGAISEMYAGATMDDTPTPNADQRRLAAKTLAGNIAEQGTENSSP